MTSRFYSSETASIKVREVLNMKSINQKRKGNQLLVTLCMTSVFLLLLLCGGDPGTNGNTAMHDYICTNGVKASGTTTTPNTEKCSSCNSGFALNNEMCAMPGVTEHPYICTNGVKASGTTTTENTQKCSSCNSGFALDNEMCKLTVSLSLACSDDYIEANGIGTTPKTPPSECTNSPIEITNTIKDDNLPIYTVTRSDPTTSSLTVTLSWVITGSDASTALTRYLGNPKLSFQSTDQNFPACIIHIKNDDEDGYYTFKFLEDGTGQAPTVNETNKSITVTIPADEPSVSFRLDPFECPDLRSKQNGSGAAMGAYATVSINIKTTTDSHQLMVVNTPKVLKIKYENEAVNSDN